MTIPPGAYDDVARLQTEHIKRPDGADATAFKQQATSLKAVRNAVNTHETEIAELKAFKEAMLARPF